MKKAIIFILILITSIYSCIPAKSEFQAVCIFDDFSQSDTIRFERENVWLMPDTLFEYRQGCIIKLWRVTK